MPKRKGAGPGRWNVILENAKDAGVHLSSESTTQRYLSPNEVAKIMNVTGEAVKQWIYHHRLPAVKLSNGYWKVKVSDFEAYLKAKHEMVQRRVLVTDTAPTGAMSAMVDAIVQLGHRPLLAANYADALLKSLDHRPALFIINLSFTAFQPWKLAETIRSTKGLRKIPILLVANSDIPDADAERALQLQARGFIKLPAETATLSVEIQRIMTSL